MAEVIDTFIDETSFGAEMQAKAKYGENNYEVVNTRTVHRKSHFGLVQKVLTEITVRANEKRPEISPFLVSPTTLMEETSMYEPKIESVMENKPINKYKKSMTMVRTKVDGIHGIQEGEDEPKSLKNHINYNDPTSENATILLDTLNTIKSGRERKKSIDRELKINTFTSKKFEELQRQIEALQTAITNFANSSTNFLAENQLPLGLNDLEKELQEIETPQEVIKDLFKVLKLNYNKETLNESKASFQALHTLIKNSLNISSQFELKKSNSPQVIVLMGPTGVGKTTTLAKLAARFCLNPSKPIKACFFNIDFYKLGAKDQLKKYAEIFRIPLVDITSIGSLDYSLKMHKNDDLIIVDTAGRSQYAYEDLEELSLYLNRIPNATKYLTLSSTSKYSDLKEIVNRFGKIGFDQLILTKTDETKTIGPAIGLLLKSNIPLAYITHGQSVPEDYKVANFDFFEERIFYAMQNSNISRQQFL